VAWAAVWLAARVDGLFTRQVALKLIQSGLMGRVLIERLAREREILASLNHPNIARLFEGDSRRTVNHTSRSSSSG